ncbi:MAG: roadblock/LC7 domain-containing protein [Verrucomicrobia bacterium]|nr:roadblock/LC7 domain-containing protein [Verrucomicrobiota bacterium]
MSLSDRLQSILNELRSALPDVRGALISSADGMLIAQNVSSGDSNRMAAMVATSLGLGKRMCESFGAGNLSETSVSGDAGQVFIYGAGSKGVLAVINPAGGNIGLLHLECRAAARRVAEVLG